MTGIVSTRGLGKRYRRRWALADCTLDIPAGRVTGLVGPNGAGKTTLLSLAVGMLAPTTGSISVCGGRPAAGPAQLAKVGYVAQDTPTYPHLTVADHLRLGARLNPRWDASVARSRMAALGVDPGQRAGRLSGGQRAQLALTLGLAKRPDLERVCDHLLVLVDSTVRVAGDLEDLLEGHHRLTGPRRDPATLPTDQHVVSESHTDRQTTLVVRSDGPILDPAWTVGRLGLEDIVLAHLSRPTVAARPALEVLR